MVGAKILLVEDESDIEKSIRRYLEYRSYQLLMAEDGEQALQMIQQEKPDVVILDVVLSAHNSAEICKQIREITSAPIIFVSGEKDVDDIINGFELGADDYITKPYEPKILVTRIKAHLRRQWLQQQKQAKQPLPVVESLTRRETEILLCIAKGMTNNEIAASFQISTGTVKGYNNQLYAKLHVKNRIQAVIRAREMGLLPKK